MNSQIYTPPKQAGKYTVSGPTYEEDRYGTVHHSLYRDIRNEEIGRVLREINPHRKPLRILEVGCGTGIVLSYLASQPQQHQIWGFDGSPEMLEQARERVGENANVELTLGNALEMPFEDKFFDVVIALRFIHLFEHETKKQLYREFRRLLADRGSTIVEFYGRPFATFRYYFMGLRKQKTKAGFFKHYPTRREVRDLTSPSFKRRPVRLAGSRLLIRVAGQKMLSRLTTNLPFANRNPLVDEYLVISGR